MWAQKMKSEHNIDFVRKHKTRKENINQRALFPSINFTTVWRWLNIDRVKKNNKAFFLG